MDQGGQGQGIIGSRDRGRSCYVDSNIIISLALHDDDYDAVRSMVEGSPGILTSTWGIVEVAAVLHRRLKDEEMLGRLKLLGDVKRLLKAGGPSMLIDYLLRDAMRSANLSVPDEDLGLAELRIGSITARSPAIYRDAVDLAPRLGLSAGDLLHIAYARRASAACFVTLDREIIRRRSEIEELTGLSVLGGRR